MEDKLKHLRKIIYEPEHERGVTCWCRPKVFRSNVGIMHIVHNEQRELLTRYVQEHFT